MIEQVFGERIIKGDRYVSSTYLFVFRHEGRLVRALRVTPDRFVGEGAGQWWGQEVTCASASREG